MRGLRQKISSIIILGVINYDRTYQVEFVDAYHILIRFFSLWNLYLIFIFRWLTLHNSVSRDLPYLLLISSCNNLNSYIQFVNTRIDQGKYTTYHRIDCLFHIIWASGTTRISRQLDVVIWYDVYDWLTSWNLNYHFLRYNKLWATHQVQFDDAYQILIQFLIMKSI